MARTALAILVTTVLIAGAMAPGALAATDDDFAVTVEQSDDGSATVSVTENGSAAANASVEVATADANATYDGAGEYTADANGTVGLPAPNETVTVDVTAAYENATANTTFELVAENDTEETDPADLSFGERVSTLVHDLQNDSNTSGPFGLLVAQFAATQNPGNGQGPPPMAGPGGANETDDGGPPEFVGNESDDGGASEHAGDGDGESDERGPPEHAGGDDNESGDSGPPEHAGN